MTTTAPLPDQTDQPSWWQRFRFTPLSDLIRGNITGRLSVTCLVRDANLPQTCTTLILNVVRRSRLWRSEKREVARELIAHFQDGLESGATPAQLARVFGDSDQAALLIRRAKKRNRPMLWRAGKRTIQGMVLGPIILLLLYVPLAIRFFIGTPTVSHNYVADLNKIAVAIPAESRAWPLYRQALLAMPDLKESIAFTNSLHPAGVKPGDADWPKVEQFVLKHADQLALIRNAASMPGLGFTISTQISAEDRALWPSQEPGDAFGEQNFLFGVLLPYMTEFRRLSYVLVIDARRAAAAGDSQTVMADFNAILGIVRHTRETPVLIGDLVALAVFQMMLDRVGDLLANQPELFSDAQLQQLAHHIAAFGEDDLAIRYSGERMSFHDMVQRIYTDDGNGDGRVTMHGVRLFNKLIKLGTESKEILPAKSWEMAALPAASALMLGRREILREYDRAMDAMQRTATMPLWQRQDSGINNQIATWQASSIDKIRYMPLAFMLPAIDHASLQPHYVMSSRDATLAAIALKLHRRRHAMWATTLNELVPSLLPAVPVDRFDGTPLKYALINGKPLLYSVGSDRVDDGGRAVVDAAGVINNASAKRWVDAQFAAEGKAGRVTYPLPERFPDGDWLLWPQPIVPPTPAPPTSSEE